MADEEPAGETDAGNLAAKLAKGLFEAGADIIIAAPDRRAQHRVELSLIEDAGRAHGGIGTGDLLFLEAGETDSI